MIRTGLAALTLAALALAQTPDKNALTEGVAAFKSARYAQAAELLRRAADASPGDPTARLYLARALMMQYVPGDETPANVRLATDAEREFQAVLGMQPDNLEALDSIANLHHLRKSLDESAYWFRRITAAHPNNKTAHYSLGVIAWGKFYPALMEARNRIGMKPEDPGPLSDAAIRAELRSRMLQTVNDGMRSLERALEIDPAYGDAMAYLNLLYRERADLYDSVDDYKRDVAIADTWVQRALEAKKRAAEQGLTAPAGSGIPQIRVMAPPPPPPPPPAGGWPVPKQIRVGGNVQAAKLIEKPEPLHPPQAVTARIQGIVRFNAMIQRDGTIGNLTLVSGHSLLVPSATEAVRRYRYQPTLLNGEPVEVITQIDVNFALPQ